MNEIYLMCIITERDLRDKYNQFFIDNNIPVTFSTLGKGTASNATLDYFGLEANDKVIYLAVVTRETWNNLKKQLYYKMRIDVPGMGIAFLIPLSSIGGKRALQYLTAEQTVVIEEESTLKETKHELLVIIANAGYTETIMNAAKSAEAAGGTVIHAKGTGSKYARQFLGISVTEEKEIILIVVKASQKNAIMKAVMKQVGVGTECPANPILFSLPVTSIAGLRMLEDV